MANLATLFASVQTAGAPGGPSTYVVPPYTNSGGQDPYRTTVQMAAGTFYTLSSILGNATFTGTALLILQPVGTTTSVLYWGTSTTMSPIAFNQVPAIIGGGIVANSFTTFTAIGLCVSVANTYEIFLA